MSDRPTAQLAYGRQRVLEIALALAAKPKVLLLDEPAAGVPQRESGEILDAIVALPDDIAVLFIEHDIDLVFRFARAHHGAGRRAAFSARARRRRSPPIPKCADLSRR